MKSTPFLRRIVSLIALATAGCSPALDPSAPADDSTLEEARHRHDMRAPGPDLSRAPDLRGGDLGSGTCPPPTPTAPACDQRHAGITGIQLLVRIDEYHGVIHGRNGDHEIAYGTVVCTPWVYDPRVVDTDNVQLALNLASAKDPSGLPHEVPVGVSQLVEVAGEFIPAATASAHDARGPAAVVHFTHSPCGYARIDGQLYR